MLKEESGSDAPGVRTMCPTRWTIHADSLASVIANYSNIQELWEVALRSDIEMKARIHGVNSQMQTLRFLFCLLLSKMMLPHTKLSRTLQQPTLSTIEGHAVAMLTIDTLKGLRTDSNFDLFWEEVDKARDQLDVGDPQLPRRRKAPKSYEQGFAPAEFPASPKEEYHRVRFEALDLAVTSISTRLGF